MNTFVAVEDEKETNAVLSEIRRRLKTNAQCFRRRVSHNQTDSQAGGKEFSVCWRPEEKFWWVIKNSAWWLYGTEDPSIVRPNYLLRIACQINPQTKRCSGAIVRDTGGRYFLAHSGALGGGSVGVGKDRFVEFLKRCKKRLYEEMIAPVTYKGKKKRQMLVIGRIDSSEFPGRLAAFVLLAAAFRSKPMANRKAVDQIAQILEGDGQLERPAGVKRPRQVGLAGGTAYERDPHVVAWVRRQAGGICERCRRRAPFADRFGEPFLEIHHLRWLSNGGSDTVENAVAVCPNCHRRLHIGRDAKEQTRQLGNAIRRDTRAIDKAARRVK